MCRCERPSLCRRVPGGLHLRGRPDAVHPPRRVRGLRRLRAGVPGRGDLLRGRSPVPVGRLLQGQRRVLRRPRVARRSVEAGHHPQRPPASWPRCHRRQRESDPVGARWLGCCRASPGIRCRSFAVRARAHPDGIVDLSVGSPIDPTPAVIRDALAAASDAHGYPQTAGSAAAVRGDRRLVRAAPRRFRAHRAGGHADHRVQGARSPGSRSGWGSDPGMSWCSLGWPIPTYAVGAALAGAAVHTGDDPARVAGEHQADLAQQPRQPGRPGAGNRRTARVRWTGRANSGQ